MALCETLESRVFLSASPAKIAAAVHTGHADEGKVKSSVHALAAALTKDEKTINADLSKLGVSGAQASLIAAVSITGGTLVSNWSTSINTLAPEYNTAMSTLVSQEKQFKKNPTDANLKDEIRATLGGFTEIYVLGNNTFTFDTVAPTIYAALNAITAANPSSSKVAADIKKIETSLKAAVAKCQKAALKLFATDDGNFQALWPYA
jgi:hypothetical protein